MSTRPETETGSRLAQRLAVAGAGLAVTLVVSSLGVYTPWMRHVYAARFAILKILGLATVAFAVWLVRSGRLSAASVGRNLPRCLAAGLGLAVLCCLGVLLPTHGFLWSPLPDDPRPFDLAQQKLFWGVGPPIFALGLWLLDLARLESLRLTDRRLVLALVLLIVLVTAAVLTSGYLYGHLDHGQGG